MTDKEQSAYENREIEIMGVCAEALSNLDEIARQRALQ